MPKYQPATTAEVRAIQGPRPGTRALMATILAHYPLASSDGIYNVRRVRGSLTSWSLHAAGRAADVHVPDTPAGRKVGHDLFQRLIRPQTANALGICEVIYYNQRWDGTSGQIKPYHGKDAHKTHVHVGQTIDVASHPSVSTDPHDPLRRWFQHFLFEV